MNRLAPIVYADTEANPWSLYYTRDHEGPPIAWRVMLSAPQIIGEMLAVFVTYEDVSFVREVAIAPFPPELELKLKALLSEGELEPMKELSVPEHAELRRAYLSLPEVEEFGEGSHEAFVAAHRSGLFQSLSLYDGNRVCPIKRYVPDLEVRKAQLGLPDSWDATTYESTGVSTVWSWVDPVANPILPSDNADANDRRCKVIYGTNSRRKDLPFRPVMAAESTP